MKLVGVEELGDLNPKISETFAIDKLSNKDWRNPIIDFLKNPTGTIDQKIRYKKISYVIMGNELFKKTPKEVLLKFFSENEAYLEIFSMYSGSCGAHQASHKMKWLLF